MHAPPQDAAVPVISAAQLPEADGFLFGTGTRCAGVAQRGTRNGRDRCANRGAGGR
jgi:hypothetical protein